MAVYLVQHGLSYDKETDPERGLSPEGREKVDVIRKVARGYRVRAKCICHSGKTRARQTAEMFAESLEPVEGLKVVDNMGPLDDVKTFAGTLKNEENIMYVGHLPFMEKLASYLTSGNEEVTVFKFQNGGIVCLDQLDTGRWAIKWTLMPKIG